MKSYSITCRFIRASIVKNQNFISDTITTFGGETIKNLQGLQVQLHSFSSVTTSSLAATRVVFADKYKLALTVLLADWKPCNSSHHVSETELITLSLHILTLHCANTTESQLAPLADQAYIFCKRLWTYTLNVFLKAASVSSN